MIAIYKQGQGLSLEDLKKLWCKHDDCIWLSNPLASKETGLKVKEKLCLVCRKVIEMDIRKVEE